MDEPLAVLAIELVVIVEPKTLQAPELKKLVTQHGGSRQAAYSIGVSKAFVRQNESFWSNNCRQTLMKNSKKK